MAASARWERLAELLEARRSELNPAWSDRTIFARDAGLNYRTLSDLENARRQNFKLGWLRRVERAYEWEAGSIQNVLDGRDPTPLPVEQPTAETARGPLDLDDPDVRRIVDLGLDPNDRLVQRILNLKRTPKRGKLELLVELLEANEERHGNEQRNAG